MRVFSGFEESGSIKNAVVTTGSFDGVHIGHKMILNRLKRLAEQENGESVLITFDPHPRKVLYPETAGRDLRLINSQEEKLELLREAGLDNVIIVRFTLEFSKIKSEDFVANYLYNKLKARTVVVGFNHHFGFNKEGDYRQLLKWHEKYHFGVEEIPEQEVEHESVSSTRIRQAITAGYMQRANAYLDHYYMIMADAEPINLPEAGFPVSFLRIFITDECKLIPPAGIYAVSAVSGSLFSKGMVVINLKKDGRPEVLLHLLENNEFSGGRLTLYFHKKILGSFSFSDNRFIQKINAARTEISDLIY